VDDLSVLIPYRPDGGPRDEIFAWLLARYERLLPEAEICIGENDDEPFSRSKARNDAYRKATRDVFLVADADTMFHRDQIEAGVTLVKESGVWVLPYLWYYNLAQEFTEQVLKSQPDVTIAEPDHPSQWEHRLESWAGLLLMPRKAYEEVGGYDERFVGWGYEDNSFQLAVDTIWGPFQRLACGYCLHLWHPPGLGFASPNIAQSRMLWNQYRSASGRAERMKRVVQNFLEVR
jgi:glycosyltransferase involved in cell wall biosynthesis